MKVLLILSLMAAVGCVNFDQTAPVMQQASNNIPTRGPSSEAMVYDYQLKVADRSYVESVLMQAFNAKGSAFEATITNDVYKKYEFGGSCDRYAPSENSGVVEFTRETCYSGVSVNLPAISNPMRYSLTTKICDKLISNSGMFTRLMQNVYASGPRLKADSAALTKAYGIFFLEEVPSPEVLGALQAIADQSTTVDAGWQNVMTALCISPEWQVF